MAWLVAEGDDNAAGMDRFMQAMFEPSDSDGEDGPCVPPVLEEAHGDQEEVCMVLLNTVTPHRMDGPRPGGRSESCTGSISTILRST